jgi:hypothetical protein
MGQEEVLRALSRRKVKDGGITMNLGAERYLEQAEDALADAGGERRRSETSFLQWLMSDLGCPVPAIGLSPAELFRSGS